MRKPHTLSKRTGSKLPFRIAFLDTETNQLELPDGSLYQTLKLGYCAVTNRTKDNKLPISREYVITDIQAFWPELLKHVPTKTRLIVVMHNISFDMPVMHTFTELPKYGYKLSALYKQGVNGFVSFKAPGKEILFVDNGNFFPGKLAKWGDIVSLSKLSIDFNTATEDELLTYNKRDVFIMVKLWELWLSFLSSHNAGEFRVTTSSTAFSFYRHRFMPTKIFIHNEDEVIAKEREAYHGGRVECLFGGNLNDRWFHYIDVNSMYGYVMRNYDYPTILRGSSDISSIPSLQRKLSRYCVVADVTLETDIPYYALRANDITIYPIGIFRTTLTTEELKTALSHAHIKTIHWSAWYEKYPLFTEYVDYLYNLRLEYKKAGNEGFAQICKLLMNALYGKFGQMGTEQMIIGDCDPDIVKTEDGYNIDTKQHYHDMHIGGSIIRTIREGEAYDSFTAIAAHVTANARMYLYDLVKAIPDRHVFYMDTDSLITDDIGMHILRDKTDATKLGYLKTEHSSYYLEINAPKDYWMPPRRRTKGIRPEAKLNSDGSYTQLQWSSLQGIVRSGQKDDYIVKQITKHLNRRIRSGIQGEDGFITPFHLSLQSDQD